MRKLFNPYTSVGARDFGLLAIRVIVCILLFTHGFPKLMKLLSGDEIQFAEVFGMTQGISLTIAMLAEFVCALFVLIGFAARYAAIPIVLEMLVIVLYVHGNDPFGHKELPLLYMSFFLLIFFTGAGKFSLDYLISSKKKVV
ncbi:MAG: DoxX family protein [Chitinophagaceae bacterium]|nr:DoxX family protein [Chitinophagaceae bacterium]